MFTLNQSTGASGTSSTLAAAFPNNNILGALIIVTSTNTSGTTSTISDSQGNTYTKLNSTANYDFWYAPNVKGGANTITVVAGSGPAVWVAQEWGGVATSSVLDASNAGTATAAVGTGTVVSPSITTANANELKIGWGGIEASSPQQTTLSLGSGASNLSQEVYNALVPTAPFTTSSLEGNSAGAAGSHTASFGYNNANTSGTVTVYVGVAAFLSGGGGITTSSVGSLPIFFHPGKGISNVARFYQSPRSTAYQNRTYSISFSDSIVISDNLFSKLGRLLTDSIIVVDSIIKKTFLTFEENILLADEINRLSKVDFSDSIIVVDNIGIILIFIRKYIDDITVIDNIHKLSELPFEESIIINDKLIIGGFKKFIDSIIVTDVFHTALVTIREFIDDIIITDKFFVFIFKKFIDSILVVDTLIANIFKKFIDSIIVTDVFGIGTTQLLNFIDYFYIYDEGFSQPWLAGDYPNAYYPGGAVLFIPNFYKMVLIPPPFSTPIQEDIWGNVIDEDIIITSIRED